MTTTGLREPRYVSGGDEEHRPPRGAAYRSDRPDAARARRVRRRRRVPPRRPAGRARSPGAEANESVLPGARRGPRPGRGLPVHDPDLRRGRRVRRARPSGGARCCTTRRCATSSCGATPRRSPNEVDEMVDYVGRRGRDRPARLVRRAHHLHVVDAVSSAGSSASSSTRRFAALYHDLEQGTDAIAYVDPYADIESFRRRDAARARSRRAGPGDHGTPRRRTARRPTTTATCSTCSCRSRTTTARSASPPTSSPACSSR